MNSYVFFVWNFPQDLYLKHQEKPFLRLVMIFLDLVDRMIM
jgi:hypothetical protein